MSKRKILIIDDEADFTELVKLNLERSDKYIVREENLGRHAIEAIRDFRPDLVLLDVMMPDLDGSDIMNLIKKDDDLKNIPVIFLTAVVTNEETKRKKNIIGGYKFISKPASPDKIMKFIEEHFGD